MLSNRINRIEESGIRKVFDLATRSGGEFLNFSIGQPNFPVPQVLKEAAKRAIDDNRNAYAPTLGLPILREKIAEKLKRENNIPASTDDVMVTSGTSGGIFLVLSAVLNPGDEVILPDPYFVMYKQILNYLGVKIVCLDTYPDFHINSEKLKSLVTDRTKMIILNSPGNPTGAVYSREELESVALVARENNLLILSDEIYEKFDYDQKFFSIGSIYDKTITLNGFSKNYAVTGWRVGYVHAPQEIIEAINKLQQYTFVCAPSFAQAALAQAFDIDLTAEYDSYREKRNYICDNLKDKYEFKRSEGAFYLFVKKPQGRAGFVDELIEKKILVVPGGVFSERDDYFRISFAVDNDVLEKGIGVLRGLV